MAQQRCRERLDWRAAHCDKIKYLGVGAEVCVRGEGEEGVRHNQRSLS